VTVIQRGEKRAVQVNDAKARARRRWLGTFETEREALDAERAARLGIAPSARARTIRDWSMLWLRDYPRPAVASWRTYRYAVERINEDAGDLLLERVDRPTARRLAARWPNGTTRVARAMFADALRDGVIAANPFNFRVGRQRWGERDRLELYELRHACATLLLERGLPPHVVANHLGHTDGGGVVQRLYGHSSERGMREQIRLAFSKCDAERMQAGQRTPGNRQVSQ
jgi:integrase